MYVQYIHIMLIGKTVLFEQVGEKVSFFSKQPRHRGQIIIVIDLSCPKQEHIIWGMLRCAVQTSCCGMLFKHPTIQFCTLLASAKFPQDDSGELSIDEMIAFIES